MGEVWRLYQGEVLLGTLKVWREMPWLSGKFHPTPAFEPLRPLFQREIDLLNAEEHEAWEEAYDAIDALGLSLWAPDAEAPVREFLLHVDGDEAWFRY